MRAALIIKARHLWELRECDHRLIEILDALLSKLDPWWGPRRITSIYRSPEEEKELQRRIGRPTTWIHVTPTGGRHRAIDLEMKEPQGIADSIAQEVNGLWVYDPDRPEKKVVVTEPHGTGPHYHIQVHTRTRPRREVDHES